MYQRNSRRTCALMLTVSICLRACMFLGLDAKAAAALSQAAKDPDLTRFLLYLETGKVAPVPVLEPEGELAVVRILEPQPAPDHLGATPVEMDVVHLPLPILPDQLASAEEISVAGGCTYAYDKATLLDRPSALDFSGEGPQILIVHTHGSEAYTPEPGWEYNAQTGYRTLEPERSVIAVGEALAETLESHGISVLHDRSLNDYPSYNDSYWTTLERIEEWLVQDPGIQMVIDVHRDEVESESGKAVALSSTQNGQTAAQLMLVVGTDQGGLTHPNWQENLANALKLQSVLQGRWPGLCRKLDLRTERFNQHMTPGSLLVEVGTNGNTLQQALVSAKLLGDGLAAMIHTLEQTGGVLTTVDSPWFSSWILL